MYDYDNMPQWFKLWGIKYYEDMLVEDIEELYPTDSEKIKYFAEIGKAFVNAINYYVNHNEESYLTYIFDDHIKDGKRLFMSLKRDINQSYRDYEARVENGKKGGRPPKETAEQND